jgi:hypothetical protein
MSEERDIFPKANDQEVQDFTVHAKLVLALQKLKYKNDLDSPEWLDLKRVLTHVNIREQSDAYRVYQLIPMQSNPTVLAEFANGGSQILYDVIIACHWFSTSKKGSTPNSKDLSKAATDLFCNPDETRDTVRVSVGEIPAFKGRFAEWPDWKSSALAVIKISGLHTVATDPRYAKMHPQKNAVLHGMLTLALTKGKNPVSSLVFVGTLDDGYKAWKNLQDYFEKGPLLRHMFDLSNYQLESLKCTKIEDFSTFTNDFLHCYNHYMGYITILDSYTEGNSRAFQASRPINNWSELFLDKLTDSTLQTLKVSLKDDLKDASLWDCILILRENLLRSNSTYRQKELTLLRAPAGYNDKPKGDEDKANTKARKGDTTPPGKQGATPDPRYQKLVTTLYEKLKGMDAGSEKDALYEVINQAKEKITKKGNHSGGKRGSDNGGTYGAKGSKNPKYTKKRRRDTAPPPSPEPSDGAGVAPGDIDETFNALIDW